MSHAIEIACLIANYNAQVAKLKAERDSALTLANKLYVSKSDDFLCIMIMGTTFKDEAEHRARISFDNALRELTNEYKKLTHYDDLFMIIAEATMLAEK